MSAPFPGFARKATRVARDLRGVAPARGHCLPEAQPAEVARQFEGFLH